MKNNLYILVGFLIAFTLVSCEEEPPYINFEQPRVTYETAYIETNVPAPQLREVLIEDISGVKCVNCPDAANIIANIKASLPGRVNSITIHPNTPSLDVFTKPINKPGEGAVSKQDFRTEEGGQLLSKLGTPGSLPSGYINRKVFPGKVSRFVERTEWASSVANELDSITKVNIDVTATLNAISIITDVSLTLTDDLEGDYYVTLMLLEDSIVDVQEYQDGVSIKYDVDYVHRHVLRGIFTAFSGDKLTGSIIGGVPVTMERGRVIKKRYALPLKAAWATKHLEVLAMVHRGSDEVVVQTKKFSFH